MSTKRQYFRFDVAENGTVSVMYKPKQDGEYEETPRCVFDPSKLPAEILAVMAGQGIVKKVTADTSDVAVTDTSVENKISAFKEVWERLCAGELKKATSRGPRITPAHYTAFAEWQGLDLATAMSVITSAPSADRKLLLENPEFLEHLERVQEEAQSTEPSVGGSLADMLG